MLPKRRCSFSKCSTCGSRVCWRCLYSSDGEWVGGGTGVLSLTLTSPLVAWEEGGAVALRQFEEGQLEVLKEASRRSRTKTIWSRIASRASFLVSFFNA